MSKKNSDLKASDEINRNLRLVYEELLSEDVPERFSALLEQLKRENSKPEDEDKDD